DKKILYYKAPNKILEYDIETRTTSIIVGDKNFPNGLIMDEYPVFNYSNNSLYYYSSVGNEACQPNSIYKYNYNDKSTEELFSGIIPMCVNNDLILYREDICGFENPSQIVLFNGIDKKNISMGN